MKPLNQLFSSALCATLFFLISCGEPGKPEGNVFISGTLGNPATDSVYIMEANSQNLKTVSATQLKEDGSFEFSFDVSEIGFYRIQTDEKNFAILILQPGDKISLEGDAQNLGYTYKVTGSEESARFQELNQYSAELARRKNIFAMRKDSLLRHYQYLLNIRKDKKYTDSLDKSIGSQYEAIYTQLNPLLEEGIAKAKKFIDENPGSLAGLVAIGLLNPEQDFETYRKLYDGLKTKYPDSKSLGGFYAWMESKMKMAPGSFAPEFTVNDPQGNPITLSSFRGNYLLVDFWASWCKPCRNENPNVVRLYKKYKPMGLEIFGVSLDENHANWMAAINMDQLTWKHGSELKGWNSSFVPMYGINGIPFTVLLDPEGKIIALNLRGPALEAKLEEIFLTKKK
jgi:thiol-disulfide isomerase/thioredoxin